MHFVILPQHEKTQDNLIQIAAKLLSINIDRGDTIIDGISYLCEYEPIRHVLTITKTSRTNGWFGTDINIETILILSAISVDNFTVENDIKKIKHVEISQPQPIAADNDKLHNKKPHNEKTDKKLSNENRTLTDAEWQTVCFRRKKGLKN